jgi:mannonate dehydratase
VTVRIRVSDREARLAVDGKMAITLRARHSGARHEGGDDMRIAMGQFREIDDDAIYRCCAQLGASGVVINSPDIGEAPWREADLVRLRERVEQFDLRLEAIENVPEDHLREAIIGGPGRDACVANFQETVRALGSA